MPEIYTGRLMLLLSHLAITRWYLHNAFSLISYFNPCMVRRRTWGVDLLADRHRPRKQMFFACHRNGLEDLDLVYTPFVWFSMMLHFLRCDCAVISVNTI